MTKIQITKLNSNRYCAELNRMTQQQVQGGNGGELGFDKQLYNQLIKGLTAEDADWRRTKKGALVINISRDSGSGNNIQQSP